MPSAPEGWNTHDQIRDHKLATSIINGHSEEGNVVFDASNLDFLQQFVLNPAMTREQILQDNEWIDEAGQKAGTKAVEKDGSLVGYLVARHGTDDPALDERDLELLKEWFEKGMPTVQNVSR